MTDEVAVSIVSLSAQQVGCVQHFFSFRDAGRVDGPRDGAYLLFLTTIIRCREVYRLETRDMGSARPPGKAKFDSTRGLWRFPLACAGEQFRHSMTGPSWNPARSMVSRQGKGLALLIRS